MRVHEFNGRGYATPANALRKLQQVAGAAGNATALVAINPETGKFYPCILYRDGLVINVSQLLLAGVTVIN